MIDTFNNVNGDAFNGLDDDEDDLPFSIDGGPAEEKEPKPVKTKVASQEDEDIFDEPVSADSDDADPNDILNAAADDPDDNYDTDEYHQFNSKNPEESVQEYYNNPVPENAFNVDDDSQSSDTADPYMNDYSQSPDTNAPQPQDNPFSARQNSAQQDTRYESIPDASQQPYTQDPQEYYQHAPQAPVAPLQQPYQPQQPASTNHPENDERQQSPSPRTSSFSIPKPDMIARIIVVADTLRNDLSNDEKEAVNSVLDITAIRHDEISEMVYSILNARKSTMTALHDFLDAHEMDPSSRAFYLIRLEDSELKKMVELGIKFGYEQSNRQESSDHILIAQSAESAISGTPEPSISLMQSVNAVYMKSQEILHG